MCFFFNDTATTEIYTLSLHDALPIWGGVVRRGARLAGSGGRSMKVAYVFSTSGHTASYKLGKMILPQLEEGRHGVEDRKSTRLNSSHANISYAVFCLKKKIEHLESST